MIEIPLTQGRIALIDDSDADVVDKYKWCASKQEDKYSVRYYAISAVPHPLRPTKQINLRLHRLLLGLPFYDPRQGDHKNGDGLDNRRENIRIASRIDNSHNMARHLDSKSIYKGAHWHFDKRDMRGRWEARITVNGKQITLGSFDNEADAARTYNLAAVKYFGEFARLNIIA